MPTNSADDAYIDLMEVLDHWKDGTRPGDSAITRQDVAWAIRTLIKAEIEESEVNHANR